MLLWSGVIIGLCFFDEFCEIIGDLVGTLFIFKDLVWREVPGVSLIFLTDWLLMGEKTLPLVFVILRKEDSPPIDGLSSVDDPWMFEPTSSLCMLKSA